MIESQIRRATQTISNLYGRVSAFFRQPKNAVFFILLSIVLITLFAYLFWGSDSAAAAIVSVTTLRVLEPLRARINVNLTILNQIQRRFGERPSKRPLMLLLFRDSHRALFPLNLTRAKMDAHCEWKCEYAFGGGREDDRFDGLFMESWAAGALNPSVELPPRTSSEQRLFIYFREAPTGDDRQYYERLPLHSINYTVGFVPGADIYAGYSEFAPKGMHYFGREKMPEPESAESDWERVEALALNKTEPGFAVISHCNTYSRREVYLDEMKRRWPEGVALFGKCYGGHCEKDACLTENLKRHHFYFAFENSICDRYVTEKFFHIRDLVVPVVFRRSDYQHLLPNSSYISVDDFRTMDDLIDHLKFLMATPSEYLKYFEWTRHFEREGPSQFRRALCQACGRLHDDQHETSTYRDIAEWYSPKRLCDNSYVERLFERQTDKRMPKRDPLAWIAG